MSDPDVEITTESDLEAPSVFYDGFDVVQYLPGMEMEPNRIIMFFPLLSSWTSDNNGAYARMCREVGSQRALKVYVYDLVSLPHVDDAPPELGYDPDCTNIPQLAFFCNNTRIVRKVYNITHPNAVLKAYNDELWKALSC